jgi:hypothetical protein
VASGNKNSPETQDSKTSPETTIASSPARIRREMTTEEIRAAADRTRHIFTPEWKAAVTARVIEASRKARQETEEYFRKLQEEAELEKQAQRPDGSHSRK